MPSKLGVHEKINSYMNHIYESSNDSNGFTSFKISVLKQRFSILFLASPCSASLSLSFRSLARQLHQRTVFQLYTLCVSTDRYFSHVLCASIRLKLISNIDDVIVYNTTGAHAAEERGGTFRHALEVV